MKPENYFLRYALPCAHILLDKKEITENELKELEDAAVHNKPVSKKMLEKIFHRAFEKMKNYSGDFDVQTIRQYFQIFHNKEIDKKEGYYAGVSDMQRELSKVVIAEVIEKKKDVMVVKYEGKKRNVFSKITPDAKVGDKVYIHFFYAVEKAKTLAHTCGIQ